MIQLSADVSLSTLPAGVAGLPAASDGAFPNLLGLLLNSQFAPIVGLESTEGLGQGVLGEAGVGQEGEIATSLSSEALLGQLLAQYLGSPQSGLTQTQALSALEQDVDLSELVDAVSKGQKKLPNLPAVLAGLLAQAKQGTEVSDAPADILTKSLTVQLAKDVAGLPVKLAPEALLGTVKPSSPLPGASIPENGSVGQSLTGLHGMVSPLSRDADPAATGVRLTSAMTMPMATPEWRAELGDKIAWMVGRQAQVAELILNPPSMGAIEVRLNMNLAGNEAGAQFFSSNAHVRDALEAAFPRLKELMAEAGIALGNTTVSQQSFSGQQGQAGGERQQSAFFQSATALPGFEMVTHAGIKALSNSVDLYI